MTEHLMTAKELAGLRVFECKHSRKHPDLMKRVGKVRSCVFHPSDRRCVGLLVRRPDVALMFRRHDMFVSIHGFELIDGHVVIKDDPAATDSGACKDLHIDLDECVLWTGLPVMTADGQSLGLVGSVTFDQESGDVISLQVNAGATANALLGRREIPVSMVQGFRRGVGTRLVYSNNVDENAEFGAILVSDDALALKGEGGLAEKAGEATAIAMDKAHHAVEAAKPKVEEAAVVAGKVIDQGAKATGRQLVRAKGMFSEFKNEYDKAVNGSPSDEEGTRVKHYGMKDPDGGITLISAENAGSADAQRAEVSQSDDFAADVGKKVGAHLKSAGGMFAAFKDEFDKAMHE